MRTERWFPLSLVTVLLASTAVTSSRPALSYQVVALGAHSAEVGWTVAISAAASLAVAVPVGRLIDARHHRLANVLGLVAIAAGCVTAAVAHHLTLLYAASAAIGIGQLLQLASTQSMIPEWSRLELIDGRFGHSTLVNSIGQLLGVMSIGLFGQAGAAGANAGPVLLVTGAGCVVALPFAVLARPRVLPLPRSAPSGAARSRPSAFRVLRRRGIAPAMLSSLAVLAGIDLLAAYLPLLGEAIGLGVAAVSALLSVRVAATVFSRVLLPWLTLRFGSRPLLVGATGISAVALFLVPLAGWFWWLAPLMVVLGLFWGVGQPLTMSWVSRAAEPGTVATALSLRLAGNRLGQMIVPVCAGLVATLSGPGAPFVVSGVLHAVAACSTWRATRADGGEERAQE